MLEEIALQPVGADLDFLASGGKNYFNRRSHHQDHFEQFKTSAYHLDTLALSRPTAESQNALIIADHLLTAIIDEREDFINQSLGVVLD